MTNVGFLHPGAMGATIAATCTATAHWVGTDRSDATRQRAVDAGLVELDGLALMAEACDVIVSICPPASAVDVAGAVAETGFSGTYVDANAISPDSARRIADLHALFVDGGIVGPPVHNPGTTRLYVSGDEATTIGELWADTDLEVRIVEGGPGAASAVKMAFAAWTKGTSALLVAIRTLARAEGIDEALLGEWATSLPQLVDRSAATAATVAPKAWRFAGEMEEVADTFAAVDLPDGFHRAAAEIYRRLASFKDADAVDLDMVTEALGSAATPTREG